MKRCVRTLVGVLALAVPLVAAAKLSVKEYPGILLDVSFDNNGDLDRESFLVKVVNGKQVVTDTLPPASK